MANHGHRILVPEGADGFGRAFAPAHRAYAGVIHARRRRTGPFWQGRFGAVAMDEAHLAAALRSGARNPVRARRVPRPEDGRWSNVPAHLAREPDGITHDRARTGALPRLRGAGRNRKA